MKKKTLIFLLLLFANTIFSQDQTPLDSLLSIEQKGIWQDKKHEADVYAEISFLFLNHNQEKAKYYALKTLEISEDANHLKGIASAYMRLGTLYRNESKYEEAIEYFSNALTSRIKLGDDTTIAKTYNSLGTVYLKKGALEDAKKQFESGIAVLANQSTNTNILAKLYNNLGEVERKAERYGEAFIYVKKSCEIAKDMDDPFRLSSALLNTAHVYFDIGNYEEATNAYQEAIRVFEKLEDQNGIAQSYIGLGSVAYDRKQYEEAIQYFDQALQADDYLSESDRMLIYSNKGNSYLQLQQLESALQNFNTYLAYQLDVGNDIEIASAYLDIGDVYAQQKKFQQALDFYHKSATYLHDYEDKGILTNLYLSMHAAFYALKDYKNATDYLAKAEHIEDDLRNSELAAAHHQTSAQMLENAQKDNDILQGKLDLETQKLKNQQIKNYSIGGGGLLFAFLVTLGFVGYHQRQKRLSAEQEIDNLLTEVELKATYARLDGQDTERKRIAQDLHDGLGSMLATIKMYFSSIEEKLDEIRADSRDQYHQATTLLDKACDEVRKVAHEMKSGILAKFGLKAALEDLAKVVEGSKKIEVELVTYGMEERLDNRIETQIYRIVQEVINNTLKYAQANKISIELNRFDDLISLLIEDDGIGFDVQKAKEKGGMGIVGMEARVKEIQGTIDIDTKIGRGTSISIDIPYEQ